MLDALTLFDLGVAVKDAIETHWPGDAEPLPDRRFVSNGSMVWDCDQLAIGVDRTFGTLGDPAFESVSAQASGGLTYVVTAATVTALLLRCVPMVETDENDEVISIPTSTEMQDSAQLILSDSINLYNALLLAYQAGELAPCQGLAFESGQAEGPEGGLGGWSIKIRAALL
jgi:hypothetical protein